MERPFILVLRRAQDADDWEKAGLKIFLMLSLSKHEEVAPNPPTPNPLPLKGGKG
jgi:hypothetical protein